MVTTLSVPFGSNPQLLVMALTMAWVCFCTALAAAPARGAQAKLQRCLIGGVLAGVSGGVWLLVNRLMFGRFSDAMGVYGTEWPLVLAFGWKEAPLVFLAGALCFAPLGLAAVVPAWALPALAPEGPRAGRKAALLGALWGCFFIQPFPLASASWGALLAPLAGAVLAFAFQSVLRRLPPDKEALTEPRLVQAACGVFILLWAAFALQVELRFPKPSWSLARLEAALDSEDPSIAMGAGSLLGKAGLAGQAEAFDIIERGLTFDYSKESGEQEYRRGERRYQAARAGLSSLGPARCETPVRGRLIAMLKRGASSGARREAARTLSGCFQAEVLDAAAAALDDPENGVRLEAAVSWQRLSPEIAKAIGETYASPQEVGNDLLRRSLREKGAEQRRQAIQGSSFERALVVAIMEDRSLSVRHAAISAARSLRLASARPALLQAITDADQGIRNAAQGALKEVGLPPEALLKEFSAVWSKDKDLSVRRRGILALGVLKVPGAEPALIQELSDHASPARPQAAAALAYFCGEPARRALLDAAKDEFAAVREEAVRSLGRCRVKGAEAALVRALSDGDRRVRVAAVEALAALPPLPKGSVPALGKLAEDPALSAWDRMGAIRILAKSGYREAQPAFLAALKSRDPEMRNHALNGLSRAGLSDPSAVAAVVEVLRSDPVHWLRCNAAAHLGVSRQAAAAEPLLAALADESPFVRRDAVLALGALGPAKTGAEARLIAAVELEPDLRVLRAGASVLESLGTPAATAAADRIKSRMPEPEGR